jgi:hypothetical protein
MSEEVMSTVIELAARIEDRRNPRPSALQARAAGLRREAQGLPPRLSIAYKRRASELELMAWAIGHGPPGDVDLDRPNDCGGVAC